MMSLDDDNISLPSFLGYVAFGMALVYILCMIPS